MNTRPDDELLALWLEDELDPAGNTEVEAWIAEHEEWPAWRRETREWKRTLRHALPSEQTPPACEFFEARLQRIVRESPHGADSADRPDRADRAATPTNARKTRHRMPWLPVAAAAGMALCFWGGTRFSNPAAPAPAPAPTPLASAPILYTPEQGVEAQMFESENAHAMVIVLDGVTAIPDSAQITAGEKTHRPPGTGMAEAASEPKKDRIQ
jgi:hypothetical protein